MVNGIDSLITVSDFSLLVCAISSDFCVLILHPATLLNSLIALVISGYVQYHIIFKH